MKAKNFLILVSAMLLLWLTVPAHAYGETDSAFGEPEFSDGRSIYAGDIITLEISAQGFSAEELREKFHDFEIVELKEEAGGYLISLRTFETGEYTVLLGDKEIVINVGSVLDDIQREDIFEGDIRVIEPGISFHWRVLFYIAAGIFILSVGFILFQIVRKRKIKELSPYQMFLRQTGALSVEDDNYFVDLTFYFKEYLGSLYQCRIIGKTSAEIINELKRLHVPDVMLPGVQEWLAECDRLKFTGIMVTIAEKQEHYEKLLDLVGKIDTQEIIM